MMIKKEERSPLKHLLRYMHDSLCVTVLELSEITGLSQPTISRLLKEEDQYVEL